MSLLCSAKRCIGRFVDFFFDFSGGFSLFFLLNGAILLLLAVLITSSILRMRIWKERYSFVLLLVCMGLMPFAATAVYFGNANLDYHNLMLSAYGLVYIFLLLFYERCLGERKWYTCAGQWMILLLTALTVYNFSVIANVSYHKMQMAYEKSYGAALQIAD